MQTGLALYTVARLHLTQLRVDETLKATLHGSVSGEGMINLSVAAEWTVHDGAQVQVASPMITTRLQAADWCDAALATIPPGDDGAHWLAPVELVPGPRIKPL
jgi:hypothetical protein